MIKQSYVLKLTLSQAIFIKPFIQATSGIFTYSNAIV